MVLVDSSVWVAFLYGRAPFLQTVAGLSIADSVVGHEFVYGELLMGDVRGGRTRMLADYRKLTYARTIPHAEVEALVRMRDLQAQGIGWVDAHLAASAMAERVWLYTADGPLRDVATSLGIAYSP